MSRPAPRSPAGSELRASVEEAVLEHTRIRRQFLENEYRQQNPRATPAEVKLYLDANQPLYDAFDPVVQLAIFAADHANDPKLRRQAMSDVAPYLRPKLKQVEHINDPESLVIEERKNTIAQHLLDAMSKMSMSKMNQTSEVVTSSDESS